MSTHPLMPTFWTPEDNVKQFEELRTNLSYLLLVPKSMVDLKSALYMPWQFGLEIEEIFIKNGYSMTFREVKQKDEKDLNYYSERFFYRPNKLK